MKKCKVHYNRTTITGYVVATEENPSDRSTRYVVSTLDGELLSVSPELVEFI